MDKTQVFQLGGRTVGGGAPCLIVAEVGQAHDGSLGTAHSYIDAAAKTGVDAIKFQTHIAAAESTPAEPFRVRFSPQDATRYDYWRRMEFTQEQWAGLATHASESGLIFLSSPFSSQAAALLEKIGVPAWKVGAGETANLPFLRELASTGKPILLSSGLVGWEDLDRAVTAVRDAGAPVGVYQCTTAYPCPPEKLGLNLLADLRNRYNCPVGISDHSGTIYAGLAAISLGVDMLEVHITFSRDCFGPDVSASVTIKELDCLVRGIRFIEQAMANPVDKDRIAADLVDLRRLFGKSVVTAHALEAGHRLGSGDLVLKKPGTGIPAADIDRVLGHTTRRSIPADHLLTEDDLE